MDGCVCLVYVGMSVCRSWCFVGPCVFVRGALQAGGSERLGPFNTALIRDTHAHNGSNETLKAAGSQITILCFRHISVP